MTAVAISWWGHATTTIELAGTRVLTDPVLTDRIVHLRRLAGGRPGAAAREADVVAISHLHADHLHLPSLALLPPATRLIAPRGTRGLLRGRYAALAADLTEVEAGDEVRVGEVTLRAVPAHHDGRRLPRSRHDGPALGYVLTGGDARVWFAGDTGLFDGLAEVGPVDVAVVPVGGWGPTLGPHHLDPAQAAEAVDRVGARDAVPMHYGTFWPVGLRRLSPASFLHRFAAPGPHFVAEARRRCPRATVHLLAHGGTARIAVPSPRPAAGTGSDAVPR